MGCRMVYSRKPSSLAAKRDLRVPPPIIENLPKRVLEQVLTAWGLDWMLCGLHSAHHSSCASHCRPAALCLPAGRIQLHRSTQAQSFI